MVNPTPTSAPIELPSRLAFLQGSLTPILAWPALCLLLAALVWALTLSIVRADRAFLDANARKNASYIATGYAQHLTRLIDQADQIALHVRFDREQLNTGLRLDVLRRNGLFPDTGLLQVSVIDRNGTPVTSTLPLDHPANVADAAYFQAQRDSVADRLFIGKPVAGGLIDRPSIALSRRLQDRDGNFDGAVVVSVEPGYFSAFFDRSSLGQADLLAVLGKDGTVQGSRIGNTAYPTTSPALRKVPSMNPPQRGVTRIADPDTFADGEPRYLAWQALGAYPFVTLVGLSEQQLLAPYVDIWNTYRRGAIGASVFLLLLSVVGASLSIRLAWRKHQAEQVKRTYRIATEGGNEGFYMVRALFDSEQHITDFLIEDCNERGALLIGARRDALLGTRFSDHYSGIQKEVVLNTFRNAMHAGFFEDEFKVTDDSPLHGNWLYRRLVRSGTGLAMTLRDITAAKKHHNELARVANEDALTSLPSRHWLTTFLPEALVRAANAGTMLALLFVDLDGFKGVNDTLGHAAGDELLKQAAMRLKSVLRPTDNVVRLGGDEFTVILEPIMVEADATRVAVRIVEAFSTPFELSQGVKSVGASVGIGMYPRDGREQEALLRNADTAMYRAKSEGKNQYRLYEPDDEAESSHHKV
ncbi:diguanylate cyclase (GGDEF)-like protein [Actimicrobium sp. GrIS 1.19]|uniref:bifunctional diguanylate cyclase/phosphodiesterase n=1 Tax=Actimicrobium sp. GrIS 1.19 TaxID=3071708 RepID=UPI002DF97E9E|nr:diguanylate cyclase (GGDEF)-like protein [Actimicrobium sp. GrIS 1.19]